MGQLRLAVLSLAALPLASACGAPDIGDSCKTALDCSSSGARLCDRTQPHGYCTLAGCEPATCPEDSVCVEFRPGVPRLTSTYCMYECEDDGDCRDDEGYECLSASEFGDTSEARVLDNPRKKFCAVRSQRPDAGSSEGADAGSASDADATG